MRDRVALILTGLTAAIHLAVAGRYDLHRDELYFIVCGRHPAFGYVDQPPLVPLLAAAGATFGPHAGLVRLPAVAAAAGLVWLVIAFTRLLGGRDGAAWLAGTAAAVAPVLAGLTATLNTTTFEPLAWTLVAYALARAAVRDDHRALVWGGAVAGVALEAKYGMPLWLLALAAGILVAGPRRLLLRRELWLGVALAVAIGLPSVGWQAAHGWPFVELVHNAAAKNTAAGPVGYAINQLFVLDPLLAPLWIAGLIAPFCIGALRDVRFVPIAYALTAIVIVAGGGKDYYLAPAYPSLFALGGIALARALPARWMRGAYLAAAVAVAAVMAPLALPILDPPVLAAYMRALHLELQAQERLAVDATPLPPTFADMLGWHAFVAQVTGAWNAIPPGERGATAILVDNYGEAAALDVYGAAAGLPPALSGHNQYGRWGERGQTPRNILRVHRDPAPLRAHCDSVQIVAITAAPYAVAYENGKAIAFCRNVHPPLATLWSALRFVE